MTWDPPAATKRNRDDSAKCILLCLFVVIVIAGQCGVGGWGWLHIGVGGALGWRGGAALIFREKDPPYQYYSTITYYITVFYPLVVIMYFALH